MKKLILIFLLASTGGFCQNIISNSWYREDSILQSDTIKAGIEQVSAYRISLNLQEAMVLRSNLNAIEYSKLSIAEKRCLTSLNTYIEAFAGATDTKIGISISVPIANLSSFLDRFRLFSEEELERKKSELIDYEEKLQSKQNLYKQIRDFETKKNISKSIITQ